MDLKRLNRVKSVINSNGTETKRLQTLRLPRDLTLGGTKIKKKPIVPNVNAVRKREKRQAVEKSVNKKTKEKSVLNNKSKGFSSRFFQSKGIFSEGSAIINKPIKLEPRLYNKSESDPTVHISLPLIRKNNWKVDKRAEDVLLDELESHRLSDGEEEKFTLNPIMWAKLGPGSHKVNAASKLKGKNIGTVKKEVPTHSFMDSVERTEEHVALSLIKLPDSLAGKGLSDDPDDKRVFDYTLQELVEGRIGDLRVRRSGKMEMKIGDMTYDLSQSSRPTCAEEILVKSKEQNTDEPAFVKVENINSQYVAIPKWNALLRAKNLEIIPLN